jgi:hypothetical protein
MAILYDVSRNADQDETQWTGAQEHDHAHITMVIGQELWGPPFSNQERDAPIQRNPKIRQKDLLPHVERLQTDLAPATADILQRMAAKTVTVKEDKEEMCRNRIAAPAHSSSFRHDLGHVAPQDHGRTTAHPPRHRATRPRP